MTASQTSTEPQVIAERYRAAVEAGDLDALGELYQPEALLDAHVPDWRFQAQGAAAVTETIGTGLPRPGRFTSFDAEPTASGDLLVQSEWRQPTDEGETVVRELQRWRLEGGRIAEQIVFCAGVWDPQLQARMADEAPLVRP